MIPSILGVFWIVSGIPQHVASRVSSADGDHDFVVMLAVNSFTRTEVQHEAGGVVGHHEVQHHEEVQAEQDKQHHVMDAQHYEGTRNLSNMVHLSLEWIRNMRQAQPLTFGIVVAVALVVLAATIACCCSRRGSQRGRELQDSYTDSVEVWHKVSTCSAHEGKLMRLFKELDEAHQSPDSPPGYISAMDLHVMLRDKRVAIALAELGIPTSDFLEVFHVFESSSKGPHNGCVNLEDFINGNQGVEGKLMTLFNELDEANQSDESPPGYFTANDLRYMMQDQRVAKQFKLLGISTSDSWAVFRVLESSHGPVHGLVNLRDFIKGCKKMSSMHRAQSGYRR